MQCSCGREIPEERTEFLIEHGKPLTCLSCSRERPKLTYMDQAHKTAAYVVIVENDPEQIRLARRAFKRSR